MSSEDWYKETFDTWNKIAGLYQEKFMDLNIYDRSYDKFLADLNDGSEILEIGCGPGNISKYLLTKRPDLRLFGVDVAANMIERARINNPKAKFEVMDCRKISVINEKFDGIICGFCLPYISREETKTLISDCSQLLKVGGAIYFSFVTGDYENSGFQSGSSGDRTYFYYHSTEEIILNMLEAQFENPEIINVPYQSGNGVLQEHTIIIAKRK